MKQYNTELLAPAGNTEAFMGAIHAGADAVYLGGARFGARAYADNFTQEELIHCIRYAHIFGRKVYLTVNTLMKDQELSELYEYLAPFYEAGLDAVIVQDIGAFCYIREHFPEMELHVSTQMTITGAYGAQMLKEMGASRIVPARELSLTEIKHIKEQTGLEMETFIHGAMCYCYSGQCLFSSILGGRSGNRGRCAQPCRLPYAVDNGDMHMDACYPLSLKDMCTLEHIGELMDAGIDSFKIEGRMKKPEYAAGVTAIYRKYMDQKFKHPEKPLKIDQKDWQVLTSLYIRSERQDGYYYKQNGADMVTLDSPAYSGSDETLLQRIREKYIDAPLKRQLSMYGSFVCGEAASLTLVCGDTTVTVIGQKMEPAQNKPVTSESIEKQLSKLGDTCFTAENIQIYTDERCFCPVKSLNELRRKAVRELENALIAACGLPVERTRSSEKIIHNFSSVDKETASIITSSQNNGWSVSVSSIQQLDTVKAFLRQRIARGHEAQEKETPESKTFTVDRLYVESELLLKDPELQLPEGVSNYIALPYVMRKKDESKIGFILELAQQREDVDGILYRSPEEYYYLKTHDFDGKMIADAGVYIWNQESSDFWAGKVNVLTCPIEFNQHEWRKVHADIRDRNTSCGFEKIVYGRLPMMITANCISKTGGKCLKGDKSSVSWLTDRYHKKFPVIIQCNYCMNIVLNSVPLSLHGKEALKWYDSVSKRISFTVENSSEVMHVLEFYRNINQGSTVQPPFGEYTTGHEKRGVE